MAMASSICITDLEVEILADIFEIVNDESPRTTPSVAQVNRYFNSAVRLVRYRRETLKWSATLGRFVNQFDQAPKDLFSPDRLRGLRHLTIAKGGSFEGLASSAATAGLKELLSAVTNLKSLTYKTGRYPQPAIISVLQEKHPRADLRVYDVDKPQAHYNQLPSPEAKYLAHSCVSAFAMEVPYRHDYIDGDHRDFEHIVSNATKLKSASLTSFGIQTNRIWNWTAVPFHGKPSTSLRQFSLDGWPVSAQTLDYWARYVDLAGLETFACTRGPLSASYFVMAADVLRNLKHVSLNLSPFTCTKDTAKAAEQYIATCPSLSTLSLWSWMEKVSLSTILRQHGPTLEDLQLHMREEEVQTDFRTLTLNEIMLVRTSCPKLRRFTFDLERQSKDLKVEDYSEILDEIKRFNLESLQIYFDSGLSYMMSRHSDHLDREEEEDDDDDASDNEDSVPNCCGGGLDSSSMESIDTCFGTQEGRTLTLALHPPSSTKNIQRFTHEVWKHMFGERTTGARQLDLKFGEWERKVVPVPYRPDGQVQQDLRVWCVAKPHDRDDRKGQSQVVLKCCQGKHWEKSTTG
ncbi:hypothetical protein PV05_08810 [Exophiala xenobiotica]|uniref:F-box domain-containing protein n=1 Tax=Exophiala xenobiotica TaxID=348802 RepID=A0A0D2EEX2_9EURO|nr:uncharacterized protein PV05_08810 [Exophiala xenobiotica]KIW53220.1 hypothetical protein PV05_08810 [Exophiala xenobiotica]